MGFSFISDKEVASILSREISPSRRSVWLSFDDGFQSNLTNVVPVLIEHNIPATFFVCPTAAESGWQWFDVAREILSILPVASIEELNRLPHAQRSALITDAIAEKRFAPIRTTMTPKEISALSANPLFSFQNHTSNHALLPTCSDAEVLSELLAASDAIAQWTGVKPTFFSYPCGAYSSSHFSALKKAYIPYAVTTDPRFLDPESSNPLEIPRTAFIDNGAVSENICQTLGIWRLAIDRLKHRTTCRDDKSDP